MADDLLKQDENLRLADLRFKAIHGDEQAMESLKNDLIERKALPFYKIVATELDWAKDLALEEKLQKEIDEELVELDKKVTDAEENAGESEVRESLLARAEFFGRIFDVKQAEQAYEKTFKNTIGTGQKIDIILSLIRLGLTDLNYKLIKKNIRVAKELIEKGGDWERRNRLKVYESIYLLSKRDMKSAANLLIDSLQTFSANELFDYKQFIFYTIITSIISIDRPVLKKKIYQSPEILSVVLENQKLNNFLNSLIQCNYKEYMNLLPDILDILNENRYLNIHKNYIGRELRVIIYNQFLSSYQSITLTAMSKNFGIGIQFLDVELSRFISAGRLNCKIDMVRGIVETTRPDTKNSLYQQTIKQGDLLLNRVQKLSRVIDI